MALGPQGPAPPPAAPPGAGAPGATAGPQGPPAAPPPQLAAALAAASQKQNNAPSLMVDVAGSLPPSVQLLEAGISFFKKAVVSKEFIDNPVHQAGLRALIDDGTQLVDSISKVVIGADLPEAPAVSVGQDVGSDDIPPPEQDAE